MAENNKTPDMIDMRLTFLLLALFVYGAGSSPTPDSPGYAEIFTALFLAAAAGLWRVLRLLRPPPQTAASWEGAGRLLLYYGLSLPLVAGLASGHGPAAVARDLIAFLFLLLPLFLQGLCVYRSSYMRAVTCAVAGVGLLFSLRVLTPAFQDPSGFLWHVQAPADPFYLANAPTVLFAALLLIGRAGQATYRGGFSLPSLAQAGVFSVLAFFPLVAMMLITQRASMGVIALYIVFLLALAFIRRPYRAVLPALLLAALLWAGWDAVSAVGAEAARKTALVGINMRWAEAVAVFNEMSDAGVPAVIFGKGWGATFASPAVGGVTVNFTHSLLTTYGLKTGLLGLFLALSWLFHAGRGLWRLAHADPVLAGALAGPLAIDILLYASFKSLDFGLILLLATLASSPAAAPGGSPSSCPRGCPSNQTPK